MFKSRAAVAAALIPAALAGAASSASAATTTISDTATWRLGYEGCKVNVWGGFINSWEIQARYSAVGCTRPSQSGRTLRVSLIRPGGQPTLYRTANILQTGTSTWSAQAQLNAGTVRGNYYACATINDAKGNVIGRMYNANGQDIGNMVCANGPIK